MFGSEKVRVRVRARIRVLGLALELVLEIELRLEIELGLYIMNSSNGVAASKLVQMGILDRVSIEEMQVYKINFKFKLFFII
jgi:hypothetical protein